MFEDLEDITEIFKDFDGSDRYEMQLARWASWRERNEVSYKREWRKANRDKVKAQKQRYYAKHREHIRIVWRRNAAAYRARKRAAKG